jgi:hypothetical protein
LQQIPPELAVALRYLPVNSAGGKSMKPLRLILLMFFWMAIVQIQPATCGPIRESLNQTAPAAKRNPRKESMKKFVLGVVMFLSGMEHAQAAWGSEFKAREAKIAQYKRWLDSLGPEGSRYWVRLDAGRRPHRLYLGQGFHRADAQSQERFIDTYSSYLAGHPEKFMLIDLFDAETNKWIGEYGFGGFKMYGQPAPAAATAQRSAR